MIKKYCNEESYKIIYKKLKEFEKMIKDVCANYYHLELKEAEKDNIDVPIKFKNNTYRLNVKYNNWMYDKFTDPLDGSKIGKPFDLPKSIPYVMKTKKERKEVTILIKNLNEIPERLSRQSK